MHGDPRTFTPPRKTLQEDKEGEIKMAEEKQSPITGLFEETSSTDAPAKEVDGIIRIPTEKTNGKVHAVPDEPTPTKVVSFDELNRLEDDSLHRYKTLVAQVNTLQAALGAMRGLVGLSLLVAVYAAFKVRKLSSLVEGGAKDKKKEVIDVEEVAGTTVEVE
jgi:hypothetical protein